MHNALKSLTLAALLLCGACKSERVVPLDLPEPTLPAAREVEGWAKPSSPAPTQLAIPSDGVAMRLHVTTEVEQRATSSMELHAVVEITATVTLAGTDDGAITMTVDKPKVRLTPPVEGQAAAVEKALTGAKGKLVRANHTVRFESSPESDVVDDLLRALSFMLPPLEGDATSGSWEATWTVPMAGNAGPVLAKATTSARIAGAKDSNLGILHDVALSTVGTVMVGDTRGKSTEEGKGRGLLVLGEGGRLVRAAVALNRLATISIDDAKAGGATSVQQLVKLTASLEPADAAGN